MTIYYQESRVSSVEFMKECKDEETDFKIDPPIPEYSKLLSRRVELIEELRDLRASENSITNSPNEEFVINQVSPQVKSEAPIDIISSSPNSEAAEKMKAEKMKEIESELENINSEITKLNSSIKQIFDNILTDISHLPPSPEFTILINAESPVFSDIEFSFDATKVEVNSNTLHQEPLSGISLGNSAMLDSLMDQHFVILPGRKSSNIKSNLNQNHECIDAIAANGLMNSPKIMSEYSVGRLIQAISNNYNLKNIKFKIVHSALKVYNLHYSGISTINLPCYAVGKGEILSVFFRYIALTFFPYMTVYDAVNNIDYKYDI